MRHLAQKAITYHISPTYHPPINQTSFWDNIIHFAGTETANQHGGYSEGTLSAAERAVKLAL